jgi:hypothetical protein
VDPHLLTQQDLISSKLQDDNARSPSFRSAQIAQRLGAQLAEDIATHQLMLREPHIYHAQPSCSRQSQTLVTDFVLHKAARTAGKWGRERQWTLGQALRCSLHFLPSSY